MSESLQNKSSEPAAMRCMGTTVENRRCANEPLPGSKYCLHHKHLEVVAGQRTGRYRKALGRFAEAYQNSLNDRNLLDLLEPLAALDMLAQRLMERLADLDTVDFRNRARQHLHEYLANRDAGKKDDAEVAMKNLRTLLARGGDEDQITIRLAKLLTSNARRMEGAWEIRLARRNAVNAREVEAVMGRILDILKSETTIDVHARVTERFTQEIMGTPGSPALLGTRLPRELEAERSAPEEREG